MVDVRLYTTGSNITIQRCSLCWILASSARGCESYNVELILGVFVCNFAGDCRASIVGFPSRRICFTGGVSLVPFQILCFNCGIIADIDCFIGRNGGELICTVLGIDFGVVAGDGDIAFCIDGVAADDSRGDLGCILDIKRAAYIKARRDCIAIFSARALSGAVIGNFDFAASEGGAALDLNGGFSIRGAGGGEGGIGHGEGATNPDCSTVVGGNGFDSSTIFDGETTFVGINCRNIRSTCISSYGKALATDYNRHRSISGCNGGVTGICFYCEKTTAGNIEVTRLEIRIDAICASSYAVSAFENDIGSARDARLTCGINISIFDMEDIIGGIKIDIVVIGVCAAHYRFAILDGVGSILVEISAGNTDVGFFEGRGGGGFNPNLLEGIKLFGSSFSPVSDTIAIYTITIVTSCNFDGLETNRLTARVLVNDIEFCIISNRQLLAVDRCSFGAVTNCF